MVVARSKFSRIAVVTIALPSIAEASEWAQCASLNINHYVITSRERYSLGFIVTHFQFFPNRILILKILTLVVIAMTNIIRSRKI